MTTAVIYAIIALGLGLVYGQLGLLAMSHAALWFVGSYAAAKLLNEGVSFWLALPLSAAITLVAGGLTALPAFRLKGHHLLLVGFIITQLLVVAGNQWIALTGGQTGIVVQGGPGTVAGIDFGGTLGFYYLSVTVMLIVLALAAWLRRQPLGRRYHAVRENSQLANTLGVDDRIMIVTAFAISGVFAGAGGTLYAVNLQQIQPDLFGLSAAILLPLIVMIGGARPLWGPVAGAFIVVLLPDVIGLSPSVAQAVNGMLLIAIVLLMPAGVTGAIGGLLQRRRRTPAIAEEAA
jgi:branched-chain amino acid transport system permease protein